MVAKTYGIVKVEIINDYVDLGNNNIVKVELFEEMMIASGNITTRLEDAIYVQKKLSSEEMKRLIEFAEVKERLV